MNEEIVKVAELAVKRYAETHPRPPQVNQEQAAKMLGKSHVTVRKLIRSGIIRLNSCGDIPITEIDRVLAVKAV